MLLTTELNEVTSTFHLVMETPGDMRIEAKMTYPHTKAHKHALT